MGKGIKKVLLCKTLRLILHVKYAINWHYLWKKYATNNKNDEKYTLLYIKIAIIFLNISKFAMQNLNNLKTLKPQNLITS